MDHGQTFGPMPGLVDFTAAAERLKEADGVLMAPQMIRFSGRLFYGKGSPTSIVRLNWNTIHCEPWHYQQAHIVKAMSVESAVAAGAEVVLASLVLRTGDEEHDARNVQGFAALAEESSAWASPDRRGVPRRRLPRKARRVPRLHPENVPHHLRAGRGRHQDLLHRRRLREVVEGRPHPGLRPRRREVRVPRSTRSSWQTRRQRPAPRASSLAATSCRRKTRRSSCAA